jgi:Flavin-binding monooxygenase-like
MVTNTSRFLTCFSDPDLAGLAFLGLWEQTGPYFPPLELQAHWITYVWSGIRALPPRDQMNAGIAAYRSTRGESQLQAMHLMALLFAREAIVEPDLTAWPQFLGRYCLVRFQPFHSAWAALIASRTLENASRQKRER